MSSTIKKLNLVRETVRSMRARTGMRAGMMKVTQVPDMSVDDTSGSKPAPAPNPTGNNTGTMSIAM